MKVSYFPGCTLKTKAKELDKYAYRCAEVLGVTLKEIENWQCCGGVFTTSKDEVATKLSSVRALKDAQKKEQPLVSVCSACHNVIKQTNHAMQTDAEFADKVNRYIGEDAYDGSTKVYHYLELLRDVVGFDTLKEKVVNSLKGKKIADHVRCIVIPATQKIYLQAMEEGLLEIFIKAGCAVSTPTCGPCLGGHMGILAKGERAVATTNRNFVGRMGHPESEVYLASPYVAAASAVTGKISQPSEVM